MAYGNVKYTEPGSGTDVRFDDDGGGSKTQAVKLLDGTPGSTDYVIGDSTNGLDVDVTRVQGNVTVIGTGTFAVQVDAALPAGNNNIGDVDLASAIPAGTNYIGKVRETDGTNDVTTLFDADSGAGSQWIVGFSWRKIASGGSVEFGTATDPVRVDPTGTTTQPVSGTVTANASWARQHLHAKRRLW